MAGILDSLPGSLVLGLGILFVMNSGLRDSHWKNAVGFLRRETLAGKTGKQILQGTTSMLKSLLCLIETRCNLRFVIIPVCLDVNLDPS